MTDDQLRELIAWLNGPDALNWDAQVSVARQTIGCDGTTRFTKQWLLVHQVDAFTAFKQLACETDSPCDCMIAFCCDPDAEWEVVEQNDE